MILALSIITGVITYAFVGTTAGVITYRKTKDSYFWDEHVASIGMGILWPLCLPARYLCRASVKAADALEERAKQKLLPKASIENE